MEFLYVKAFRLLPALLFLLTATGTPPAQAAPPSGAAAVAPPARRAFCDKNQLTAYISPMTMASYDGELEMAATAGIEYLRRIRGRWLWGMKISYGYVYIRSDYDMSPGAPDFREERHTEQFAAMAYYELPIGKNMGLRLGAGVGAGLHQGVMYLSEKRSGTKALPYLNFDLTWVVRGGKHALIEFAPLIAGPSWAAWSPFKLGRRDSCGPLLFDAAFTVRAGARF